MQGSNRTDLRTALGRALLLTKLATFSMVAGLIVMYALKIAQTYVSTQENVVILAKKDSGNDRAPKYQVYYDASKQWDSTEHTLVRDYRGLTDLEIVACGLVTRSNDGVTWALFGGILVGLLLFRSLRSIPETHRERFSRSLGWKTRDWFIYVGVVAVVAAVYWFALASEQITELAGAFRCDPKIPYIGSIQLAEGCCNLLLILMAYVPLIYAVRLRAIHLSEMERLRHYGDLLTSAERLLNSGTVPMLIPTIVYYTIAVTLYLTDLKELDFIPGKGFMIDLNLSPGVLVAGTLFYYLPYLINTLHFLVSKPDNIGIRLSANPVGKYFVWLYLYQVEPDEESQKRIIVP